jgi:hypothetical protein
MVSRFIRVAVGIVVRLPRAALAEPRRDTLGGPVAGAERRTGSTFPTSRSTTSSTGGCTSSMASGEVSRHDCCRLRRQRHAVAATARNSTSPPPTSRACRAVSAPTWLTSMTRRPSSTRVRSHPGAPCPGLPYKGLARPSSDGRWLFVQNATPASSVTVVDLKARKFAAEIPTPGCWIVIPSQSAAIASPRCAATARCRASSSTTTAA